MDDRTLLERAAKAAGLRINFHPTASYQWNPLTNDGDALRLAVKLKLNIAQGDFSVGVNNEAEIDEAALVRNEAERGEVIRRAIVRAAAEIGGGSDEARDLP